MRDIVVCVSYCAIKFLPKSLSLGFESLKRNLCILKISNSKSGRVFDSHASLIRIDRNWLKSQSLLSFSKFLMYDVWSIEMVLSLVLLMWEKANVNGNSSSPQVSNLLCVPSHWHRNYFVPARSGSSTYDALIPECWTKHRKNTIAESDDVECMTIQCRCTHVDVDGWELVWIVEFISGIVGAFID